MSDPLAVAPEHPRAEIEAIAMALFKTKMLRNAGANVWTAKTAERIATRTFEWSEAFIRERDKRRAAKESPAHD